MSLILEALRKSEAERRRGQTPGLHAELPPLALAQARVRTWWLWLVPATLALAIALWLLRSTVPASASAPPVLPRETASAPKAAVAKPVLPKVPRLVPAPAPAVVAAPTSEPPPTPASETTPAPRVDTTARIVASPAAAMPTPPPPPLRQEPREDALSGAGSLADLAPDARKSLPPLKLSMHMWNDDPQRRFVILDGTRLGEGDRIGAAVVTAITRDGVVLDWNGQRLKLPIR